jgi:hypothetical protein
MKRIDTLCVTIIVALSGALRADCPLDHLVIGRNRDGIEDTADDNRLFADCGQKYRHSGDTEYAEWFYPLRESVFPSYPYRIGEPGFDVFQNTDPQEDHTYDPNRSPAGTPEIDYSITVECVALSPGLQAVHREYPQFTLATVGENFDYSHVCNQRYEPHMHMSYQATEAQTPQWITFRLCDTLADGDQYEPSEPFTIVFNVEPPAGDLAVNGRVDIADLSQFSHYWLSAESSRRNDYCERADTNRDGSVGLFDFARLAANWRLIQE